MSLDLGLTGIIQDDLMLKCLITSAKIIFFPNKIIFIGSAAENMNLFLGRPLLHLSLHPCAPVCLSCITRI